MAQPRRRIERREYWACGIDKAHRHVSRETAAACIARSVAKDRQRKTYIWNAEKLRLVLADYRAGARKSELAARLGLSKTRIADVIAKAERYERRELRAASVDALRPAAAEIQRADKLIAMLLPIATGSVSEIGKLNQKLGKIRRA